MANHYIGPQLKHYMDQHGHSVHDIARNTGYTPRLISRFLNNYPANDENLERLATAIPVAPYKLADPNWPMTLRAQERVEALLQREGLPELLDEVLKMTREHVRTRKQDGDDLQEFELRVILHQLLKRKGKRAPDS